MQEFLKQIIKEAGYIAKGFYERDVKDLDAHTKGDPTDIVTIADKAVSEFLVAKIQEKFPEHGIISEELDYEINPGAEYTWVMDPIDGTRNFANHIGVWCTMIGITKNGEPQIGAIYDALNDELFFAEKGKGAQLNDHPINVSATDDIRHFKICFGAGQIRGNSVYDVPYKIMERLVGFYNNLMKDDGHWISNYSTCLTLGHIAAGRIDAYVLCGGVYHDYLAGFVIASEAGAKFTDIDGNVWKRGRRDIVVANPKLHKKISDLIPAEL